MDRELFHAAKEGKVGEVLRTLLSGADKNVKIGEDDETPLHVACGNGHWEAALALLLVQADVEARDSDGWTPLHRATAMGHTTIVQTLLQVGADMDAKGSENVTALMMACLEGHVTVVRVLLDKGADFGAKADDGMTNLHAACWHRSGKDPSKSVEIVKMLLEKGTSVETKDGEGLTPLQVACAGGDQEVSNLVEFLLENGADLMAAENITGDTPLHRACNLCTLEGCQVALGKRGGDRSKRHLREHSTHSSSRFEL